MKSKFLIGLIGAMALCLMSACANGDVQRVQKAEELLTVNRDSAMAILREVVRRNYADLLGEIGQTDRAIHMHEELAAIYRDGDSWLLVESRRICQSRSE